MEWVRAQWGRRPWWMNLMLFFCAYMAVVYVPWDIFIKPAEIDEEVWLGYRFHGIEAKIAAVPHWIVYGFGALGFYQMKRWMHPWAAAYLLQVTIAFMVFPWIYGPGLPGSLVRSVVAGGVGGGITWAMWKSAPLFGADDGAAVPTDG